MKIDYDVGDCVVCVRKPEGDIDSAWEPVVGGYYRVHAFDTDWRGDLIVDLTEDPDCGSPEGAWEASAFRKLPKADSKFTEQMRKLKPHKQKVEARCSITGQPLSVREMFESECG